MKTARLLLVDDHTLVRRGVAALLKEDGRYEVMAEAENGEEALSLLDAAEEDALPDLVLLDLAMPGVGGLEAMRHIHHKWPRMPVVILSMHRDERIVAQALRAGARGYLLKHGLDVELFEALATALRGGRYVTPTIDMKRVASQGQEQSELTAREREVLQLVAKGYTSLEVAEQLGISPHTVTRHRTNLMEKLQVHNLMDLLRVAMAKGLIPAAGDGRETNVFGESGAGSEWV